jgi:hypothetical protein
VIERMHPTILEGSVERLRRERALIRVTEGGEDRLEQLGPNLIGRREAIVEIEDDRVHQTGLSSVGSGLVQLAGDA